MLAANKIKLILIHFAGGNSFSFRAFYPFIEAYEIISLELPGRGLKQNESLIMDFDMALTYLYAQLMEFHKKSKLDKFIIYGHSMGAILGFHLTALLEKNSLNPLSLIVTGNSGPRNRNEKKISLLDDKNFLEAVVKFGGISDALVKHPELMDYFIPILKADFAIVENYSVDESIVINTPIHAIMGDQEEYVDQITNWGKFTKAVFKYETLPGDHFFINQHAKKVAEIISKSHVANTSLST
jgi:external thioesterase TEII